MISIEVLLNGIEPPEEYSEAARRGSAAALGYEGAEGEICIELTNDAVIHRLNRDFRNTDRPTDVLSFPSAEGEELIAAPDGHLGDIMISVETAERQAEELGHSPEREIMFLAIHGTLHVLGYDHMTPEDEEIMTARQRAILNSIETAQCPREI
ncbi:MAG: rRNA maturation RNase YbeY [Clostridia bacterium]|nr:rRNA maturation RNase YbeY [Clostridia bacterium]